jgi:nucleoside-diphosphate-sugar epimerase
MTVGKRVRLVPLPALAVRGLLSTVGALARLTGQTTILSGDKANEFLAPAWTCRPDALARDAGWRARVDLHAGLRRTAAWYRERGWL